MSKIELHPQDYAVLTKYSLKITPKVLFDFQGGYELESLSQSILETLKRCVNY